MIYIGILLIIIGVICFINLEHYSEQEILENSGKFLKLSNVAGFCTIAGALILGICLVDFYFTTHPR